MSLPSTRRAAVIVGKGLEIKSLPLPKFSPYKYLVKVIAAAANPTDWKHVAFGISPQGGINGCDFAGVVVAIGDKVKGVKVGDHVSGMIHGSSYGTPDNGAYSEYAVGDPALSIVYRNKLKVSGKDFIPSGPFRTFEGASSSGISLGTVGQTFAHHFKVQFNPDGTFVLPDKFKNKSILVWGGATSVGQIAIQVAHRLGLKVIATASAKNHEHLKKIGADALFDYKDPQVVEKIKSYGGDDILLGYDTISEEHTYPLLYAAVSDNAVITTLLDVGSIKVDPRPSVEVTYTLAYYSADNVLYDGKLEEIEPVPEPVASFIYGGDEKVKIQMSIKTTEFLRWSEHLISEDKLAHIDIKVLDGLENVITANNLLQEGKVSAEKLVTLISKL